MPADSASPLLAGIPILAVILTTALGLYFGGRKAALAEGLASPGFRDVLNHADSFSVLTWAALIGDVYMAAGGLQSESKIEALKIRRAGVEVYQGQVIQDAIVAGTSLDQLNLQDGDEFEVPERGRFWTTVRNIGALAGTLILITVFVTR